MFIPWRRLVPYLPLLALVGCSETPSPSDAVQLTVAQSHACALLASGEIACWGDPRFGALGPDASSWGGMWGGDAQVVVVPGASGARDVVAGNHRTCVLHASGALDCWGRNETGQLGIGSRRHAERPTRVALSDVEEVTLGVLHTCARTDDGAVYCWGSNTSGALGDGTSIDRPSPHRVPRLRDVVEIDAGAYHTCARTDEGEVHCWGQGTSGQLGEPIGDRGTPTLLTNGATRMWTSPFETCVERTDAVTCWGSGPLADGVASREWRAVSGGTSHACAITTGGEARCWGSNGAGQLGRDVSERCDVDGEAVPCARRPIPFAASVIDVGAAGRSTCALRSDGSVLCRGGEWPPAPIGPRVTRPR